MVDPSSESAGTSDAGASAPAGPKIAVIGGGISGLSAAHRLIELAREQNRNIDVTLFEAGARTGGVFGTKRIGDYLVETGADMFITNQPAALNLCERLGITDQLIPTDSQFRGSLVLRKGKPVRVPEGFMLLSPAKIWPVLTSPIFSPAGKLRMGLEYLLPRRRGNDDETLAAFVRRRFGREALERLIQPLVGGIYTADPEKLSLQATLSRFLDMEREHRSLIIAARKKARGEETGRSGGKERNDEQSGSGARYGLFTAPREGMSVLLDRITDEVSRNATVLTQSAVSALSVSSAGGCVVSLRSGSRLDFDGAIVALPAPHAADILQPVPENRHPEARRPEVPDEEARHEPAVRPGGDAGARNSDREANGRTGALIEELREQLQKIEYSSAAVVVSGHRLTDIDHPLDAFGLVIPAIENRRILAVSFTSRKFPGRAPEGHVLLRTFVGGAMQPELLDRSDGDILVMVAEELESILGVRGQPDFAEVCWHRNSMPQYHLGHCELVDRIRELTDRLPELELAGNAYRGVGIPDCITSGESAAERVFESVVGSRKAEQP